MREFWTDTYGLRVTVIALAGHPLWRTKVGLEDGGPIAFGYVVILRWAYGSLWPLSFWMTAAYNISLCQSESIVNLDLLLRSMELMLQSKICTLGNHLLRFEITTLDQGAGNRASGEINPTHDPRENNHVLPKKVVTPERWLISVLQI